jgi:multidrug resistance efflux pump
MASTKDLEKRNQLEADRGGGRVRSMGFPRSATSQIQGSAATTLPPSSRLALAPLASPPAAKRPKGRWFVSSIILSILAFAAFTIWNEFVRYQAYGLIEGRVVQVAPNISGVVDSIHVQDGEWVQKGQLLATLDNLEVRHERERLQCEIQIARAGLEARLAEIKVNQRLALSDTTGRFAEYYRMLGELVKKQARSKELEFTLKRLFSLRYSGAISESEWISAQAAFEGHQAQLEEMKTACDKLRAVLEDLEVHDDADLLAAEVASLKAIQTRVNNSDQLVESFKVRAPAAGRIIRRLRFAGEYATTAQPILELLEEGSLAAVIYLPQKSADKLAVGEEIDLAIEPLRPAQRFVVDRIGSQVERIPPALTRMYRMNESLIPIHAVPVKGSWDLSNSGVAWIGAIVSLPRFGYRAKPFEHANKASIASTNN